MRIENGFARFEIGEKVNINLLRINYTKNNHRPYAVCEDNQETRFNVNIKDSDSGLRPGRYQIICTGINEAGFCYVELSKLQHSSWDQYDKAIHDEVSETLEQTPRHFEVGCVDLAYNINLTKQYKDKLKMEGLPVEDCQDIFYGIDEILQKLYFHYGVCVMKQMEEDDI